MPRQRHVTPLRPPCDPVAWTDPAAPVACPHAGWRPRCYRECGAARAAARPDPGPAADWARGWSTHAASSHIWPKHARRQNRASRAARLRPRCPARAAGIASARRPIRPCTLHPAWSSGGSRSAGVRVSITLGWVCLGWLWIGLGRLGTSEEGARAERGAGGRVERWAEAGSVLGWRGVAGAALGGSAGVGGWVVVGVVGVRGGGWW